MESMKLWDEEDKVEFEKKLKSLLNVGLNSDNFDNISNNKFFPKKVYDYVKTNKIKLSLTTHEGKKTDWPIEVMKPPF